MHSNTFATVALTALIPLAAAHGHVNSVVSGGKTYALQGPQWLYDQGKTADAGWRAGNGDNGFVSSDAASLASGQIACHKGKDNGPAAQPGTGPAIPVTAGSSLTIGWDTWPDTHKGPVMNYLAKCPGKCSDLKDATGLKFFKISAKGYNGPQAGSNGGLWASDDLIKAGFKASVTVPKSISNGEYVLRHEILGLHSAGSEGGAQFYPQCVSIAVTGGGSANPAGVSASTFYKSTDPSILFNLYGSITSYAIPGPAVANLAKREFTA